MSWANPHFLWLLLAVVGVIGLTFWWLRCARRSRAAVGVGVPHLTAGVGHKRAILRSVLLWSGLSLLIVALAGPRWGAGEEVQSQTGADVLLVLDCSRSMLAEDSIRHRPRRWRCEVSFVTEFNVMWRGINPSVCKDSVEGSLRGARATQLHERSCNLSSSGLGGRGWTDRRP